MLKCIVSMSRAAGSHFITLVYPSEADADKGRISVLAPLGSALIDSRSASPLTG